MIDVIFAIAVFLVFVVVFIIFTVVAAWWMALPWEVEKLRKATERIADALEKGND